MTVDFPADEEIQCRHNMKGEITDMGSEHYCLRWNNHQNNLLGVFNQLLQEESLVDVTLACAEGHSIRAHKVVLSACSSYFQSLFIEHPSRHPIVILKDVHFAELRTLVEYMYKGEVNVEYCQLSALLATAESLKVKGLTEMTNVTSVGEVSGEGQKTSVLTEVRRTPESKKNTDEDVEMSEAVTEAPSPSKRPTLIQHNSSHEGNNSCDEGVTERASPDIETLSPSSHNVEEPSDLTMPSSSTQQSAVVTATCSSSSSSSRLPSPHNTEPLPGPSSLLPVQQVPLSLKKEVDWDRSTITDDKNSTIGESSSDYRHLHDPTECVTRGVVEHLDSHSPRLFSCMYCGASFPYQNKLTRHILSHSLETLKYREPVALHQHTTFSTFTMVEPINLMDPLNFGGRPPPHESLEPPPIFTHQHHHHNENSPSPLVELDFSTTATTGVEVGTSSNVVICKFCGKTFPDVASLITHLPVHTGDRPFKCEFCGKAFKLRHHMKDHCRVHTGERPFRCSLCGKTFSRSTILKAHEKTHFPKYVRKYLSPGPLDTEEESPQQ